MPVVYIYICDCRNVNGTDKGPVTKVAELKKLKTGIASERAITGPEITSVGVRFYL